MAGASRRLYRACARRAAGGGVDASRAASDRGRSRCRSVGVTPRRREKCWRHTQHRYLGSVVPHAVSRPRSHRRRVRLDRRGPPDRGARPRHRHRTVPEHRPRPNGVASAGIGARLPAPQSGCPGGANGLRPHRVGAIAAGDRASGAVRRPLRVAELPHRRRGARAVGAARCHRRGQSRPHPLPVGARRDARRFDSLSTRVSRRSDRPSVRRRIRDTIPPRTGVDRSRPRHRGCRPRPLTRLGRCARRPTPSTTRHHGVGIARRARCDDPRRRRTQLRRLASHLCTARRRGRPCRAGSRRARRRSRNGCCTGDPAIHRDRGRALRDPAGRRSVSTPRTRSPRRQTPRHHRRRRAVADHDPQLGGAPIRHGGPADAHGRRPAEPHNAGMGCPPRQPGSTRLCDLHVGFDG